MSTIAFITDIHLDEVDMDSHGVDPYHNWQSILADMAKRKPDHVIIGGDMGASSAYLYFFKTLTDLNIQHHVILGNHDTYTDAKHHYHEPLQGDHQELYYSFDKAGFRYVFLDSSANSVSADQLQWLSHQLDTELEVLLFVHHPVLGVDTPVDRLYRMQNRDQLRTLLEATGKMITIFCGHYHMPHQQNIGNISQYITPAASYQIVEKASKIQIAGNPFGYRLITITNGNIDTELVWLNT